jgi:hypothetical protein
MVRRPSFQEELSNFLRMYPVFFSFQKKMLRSYGKAKEEATRRWELFLRENGGKIEEIENSGDVTYYKYVSRHATQAVELEEWEKTADLLEFQLWRIATELNYKPPKMPMFSRVSPYIERIPGLGNEGVSPKYLSLADCEEEDFVRDEREFSEKWNVFPHHVCQQKEPIILLRNQLLWADPKVQLFIPVSEMTTQEELQRRWESEVASMQRIFYGKKKRPNRTKFEALLKVYDLCQKYETAIVAKKLEISSSSVRKNYRRVHIDIHGVPPKKKLKENAGRRKTKLHFSGVVATHAAPEPTNEVLRRHFIELGLPLNKLDAPGKLTSKQKKLLRNALHS